MIVKIDSVPRYFTPLLDSIFIAGSFNAWDPGNAAYMLTKNIDGSYQMELDGLEGDALEFKFTRGDWERVETSASGSDIVNRMAVFADGDTLFTVIENWKDQGGTHTISGNVIELDYNFYMPELERSRRIWIYLPPDYATSDSDYPVIYMQDGQNVFDNATSFIGEWDIDGTMENIFSYSTTSAIIVAIANGEEHRIDEYSPWINPSYGGGEGDAYAQFIVNQLKPYIDENYRTIADRDHTVIGGSSLGALISYYAVLQYDETFGKAMLMSPSFWYDDSVDVFANDFVKELPFKIYITAGLNEDEDMVPDIEEVKNILIEKGFTDEEIISVIRNDGEHSEWFWKREYDDAYYWLFNIEPPLGINTIQTAAGYYDFNMQCFIADKAFSDDEYYLYDLNGRVTEQGKISNNIITFTGLHAGLYFLRIHDRIQKIIIR